MKMLHLLSALCATIFISLSMPTTAALINNGGGLIYDTVLNITWAQPNAVSSGSWEDANTWASGLMLGGVSGWRLPYISVTAGDTMIGDPVDCAFSTEPACRDNEIEYMFYYNLSGTQWNSVLTTGDADLALFPTLTDWYYWTGTRVGATTSAWYFDFGAGHRAFDGGAISGFYAWAVHDGNVVPVPAAVWLFGSGLLGLIGFARIKRSQLN